MLTLHTENLQFPWVTLVYILALASCCILLVTRSGKSGLTKTQAVTLCGISGIFGLAGGHVFFLLQNIRYTTDHWHMIFDLTGSSVSFGVYAGSIAAIFFLRLFWVFRIRNLLDAYASVLGIGIFFGRIGCFLNGCDFGKLSNLPWAVRYPAGSYAYLDQVQKGLILPNEHWSLAIHPVQLYESLTGAILFVVFTYLWRKDIFKSGILFLLFWMSYSTGRFLIECFRGDERGFISIFSTGQYCSMLVFLFSFSCFYVFFKGVRWSGI